MNHHNRSLRSPVIEVMEELPPLTRTAPASTELKCNLYANLVRNSKLSKNQRVSSTPDFQKCCHCARVKQVCRAKLSHTAHPSKPSICTHQA